MPDGTTLIHPPAPVTRHVSRHLTRTLVASATVTLLTTLLASCGDSTPTSAAPSATKATSSPLNADTSASDSAEQTPTPVRGVLSQTFEAVGCPADSDISRLVGSVVVQSDEPTSSDCFYHASGMADSITQGLHLEISGRDQPLAEARRIQTALEVTGVTVKDVAAFEGGFTSYGAGDGYCSIYFADAASHQVSVGVVDWDMPRAKDNCPAATKIAKWMVAQ